MVFEVQVETDELLAGRRCGRRTCEVPNYLYKLILQLCSRESAINRVEIQDRDHVHIRSSTTQPSNYSNSARCCGVKW